MLDKDHVCVCVYSFSISYSQDYLFASSKPRPWDCTMSELTDQPALEVVQETIREKLCKHTNQEIPYVVKQVGVAVDDAVVGHVSKC